MYLWLQMCSCGVMVTLGELILYAWVFLTMGDDKKSKYLCKMMINHLQSDNKGCNCRRCHVKRLFIVLIVVPHPVRVNTNKHFEIRRFWQILFRTLDWCSFIILYNYNIFIVIIKLNCKMTANGYHGGYFTVNLDKMFRFIKPKVKQKPHTQV